MFVCFFVSSVFVCMYVCMCRRERECVGERERVCTKYMYLVLYLRQHQNLYGSNSNFAYCKQNHNKLIKFCSGINGRFYFCIHCSE